MFGSTAERDAKPSDTQQDRVVFVGGLRRGSWAVGGSRISLRLRMRGPIWRFMGCFMLTIKPSRCFLKKN
jgi:hypothetical protein